MKKKNTKKVAEPKEQNVVFKDSKLRPLGDRVLIKVAKSADKTTVSGIFIPETASDDHGAKKGEVVAVGPGKIEDGELVPMTVSVGDKVLFQWGDEVKIEGEEYHVVSETNILAIIK